MTVLYINACVREASRTNELATYLLSKINENFLELKLNNEKIEALTKSTLEKREKLILEQNYEDEMFKYAKQFAKAETIVFSAPYWDLSFPALLKTYIELINVRGITFTYTQDGCPISLCKAKKIYYITTSGGPIISDEYGYGYIKKLTELFYGVNEVEYIKAEMLDVIGFNVENILNKAKNNIDNIFKS